MNVVFAIEPLRQAWPEFLVLARQQWDESEGYHIGQSFDPRLERYENYERNGWYFFCSARDEGKLVGYAGSFVTPSMHSQAIIATEDTWFLLPAYRRGWNAIRLFKTAQAEAAKRGAVEMTGTVKLSNRASSAILERLRYDRVAVVYSRQITQMSASNAA